MNLVLLLVLMCNAASAKALTGALHDAPFFVWDGGSRGDGLGQFDHPSGIADVGGAIAVADTRNMRVKVVSFEGYFQDFWGGDGNEPGRMRNPIGLAAAGRGMVWVVDSGNHRVQKLTLLRTDVSETNGRPRLVIGGRGTAHGKFESPSGVAVDSKSYVYVTDTGNRRVQKFTAAGTFVSAWSAGFEEPFGIAVDTADRIYVTDAALHRIMKFDRNGRLLGQWGTRGSGPGQLERPRGIAVDVDGFVYVADSGNDRIQKFSPDGSVLAVAGCRGHGVGEFVDPAAVAIDGERHLYVVDSGNHRVQKLGPQ